MLNEFIPITATLNHSPFSPMSSFLATSSPSLSATAFLPMFDFSPRSGSRLTRVLSLERLARPRRGLSRALRLRTARMLVKDSPLGSESALGLWEHLSGVVSGDGLLH